MFLRLPGVLPNRELKQTLLDHDSHARAAMARLDELDFAMTGIGAVGIAAPLQAGDNFFTTEQVARAKKLGAVGELNLRFIAQDGEPVDMEIEDLVIGASLKQLRRADRRLGVAGGQPKYRAIRAALVGGWLKRARHGLENRSVAHRASTLTGPLPVRRSTGKQPAHSHPNPVDSRIVVKFAVRRWMHVTGHAYSI